MIKVLALIVLIYCSVQIGITLVIKDLHYLGKISVEESKYYISYKYIIDKIKNVF